MCKYNIKNTKKDIFLLCNKIKQEKKLKYSHFAKLLGINTSTLKRWFLKKETPQIYFNRLNAIDNYRNKLLVDKKTEFKINDMFYTDKIEAKRLIRKSIKIIKKYINESELNNYTWIEPSAGSGSFYDEIPYKKKIGLDLFPTSEKIIKQDFLTWKPNSKKNIIIGNPPFGLRGNLALDFIKYGSDFSDFICFILPPLFNSDGKGSPMTRIPNNLKLIYEESLEGSTFTFPDGEKIIINSIFQIWTKISGVKDIRKEIQLPFTENDIKIISLSNGKTSSSRRNVKYIGKCNFYIPSTTFSKMNLYYQFNDLPHSRGYGIITKNNKIIKSIKKIKWNHWSFKSTNGANNIRISYIKNAIGSVYDK